MNPLLPGNAPGPASHRVIRSRVLQPPSATTDTGQAYRALLLAWCKVNRLDPARVANREVNVNLTDRLVSYWRTVKQDDDQLPGEMPWSSHRTQWRKETAPLLVDPAGYLAREATCGYLEKYGATLLTCQVEVSPTGEHPGQHRDDAHDIQWLNYHPGVLAYRDGRPDVSGHTPEKAHTLTLVALEQADRLPRAGMRSVDDLEAQAGRVRIVTRHAPAGAGAGPRTCTGSHAHAVWPCDDFLDAARGAVSGLETYR